jgi:hypothetical protein
LVDVGRGVFGAVKGVERQPKKPAITALTDFIKTKLYTFLYTFVFAWAKFACFYLFIVAAAGG